MTTICLKTLAKSEERAHCTLTLTERLPAFVQAPCAVTCDYQVKKSSDYYLLNLDLNAELGLTCSRCLMAYSYPFTKSITLCITHSEDKATELMSLYEVVVAGQLLSLDEIVTDELILSLPDKHENIQDCDQEMLSHVRID